MRTTFLIDGFNLYHSVKDIEAEIAAREGSCAPLRWLDIPALCRTVLRDGEFPSDFHLHQIHYFSALAEHKEATKPGITERHKRFIRALEYYGVVIHLGQFKRKAGGWEEKETDVAIGVSLIELFQTDDADAVVLMTGDTDLLPAIRSARRLFPGRPIGFAFPYRRLNNILRDVGDYCMKIKAHQYPKHQFPEIISCEDGSEICCPDRWR